MAPANSAARGRLKPNGLSMMKFAKDLGGKEMCLESMSCMLEIAAQIF
jgi:hypothetical protein